MSLATRCTACATVFRVVQDQLKVSNGWVRCGRCDAVFNGFESLLDLDREALPPLAPAMADAATFEPASTVSESTRELTRELTREPTPEPAPEPTPEPAPEPTPEPAPASSAFATVDATPPPTPTFMRVAQRPSRWHARSVRLALAGVATALLLGLTGQALHHFRDTVAARWPLALPLLTAWCQASGCVLGPLRRIDDLVVESTALTHTSEADTFTLTVGLRNRGALRVALPSLDVSLTDADAHLVARRAFAPTDFPALAPTLAPGAEALLNLTLATGSPRVRGYTVEVFYP